MGAINAQTDVGGEEVDPYSHDVLMQGMWKRGDEDVLDQEGDEDDMQYEMVTDADVKRGDVENLINLEPFYSYRRILKNQRWKRTTDLSQLQRFVETHGTHYAWNSYTAVQVHVIPASVHVYICFSCFKLNCTAT